MTALPDHTGFTSLTADGGHVAMGARPNVVEQFWGYEISPGEHVIDLGVLLRVVLMLAGLGAALAAMAVWMVPAMAFTGHALIGKTALSAGMAAFALLVFAKTALGTRVSLQVDTVNGELRETVRAITGREVVLATYGFDTIKDATVQTGEEMSQILLQTNDGGLVPAGDGHAMTLLPLMTRLKMDLGLGSGVPAQPPEFAGPLRR